MKLKRHERCPVHGIYNCCGREPGSSYARPEQRRKYASFEPGVKQIPDEHHPRGYREHRSRSAMKRLLDRKIREQHQLCGICEKPMDDYRDIVPDHIEPGGMGGGRKDDHPSNIQAAHSLCNLEKGSQRNYVHAGG
jgi:hypothetical protein